MNQEEMRLLNVRVTKKAHARLRREAFESDKSIAELVREIIEERDKVREKKEKK